MKDVMCGNGSRRKLTRNNNIIEQGVNESRQYTHNIDDSLRKTLRSDCRIGHTNNKGDT